MSEKSTVETFPADAEAHRVEIDPDKFISDCLRLTKMAEPYKKNYSGIYGVPKNGMYVAAQLSRMLDLPLDLEVTSSSLVVDDLIDSGETLLQFSHNDKAVLYTKGEQGRNRVGNKNSLFISQHFHGNPWIHFFFEKDADKDIESSVIRMLEFIGENPAREGLLETPKRMVKSWGKLYGGYKQKAEDILTTTFAEVGKYDEMVVLKDIDFFSTCEHHFLPFFGRAHIAYIPRKKVVGISKLARLVEVHARRLQIQERMTSDIAEDLQRILKPIGVAVLVEAQHFCMKARGVEKLNSMMVTSKLMGVFKNKEKTRAEFLRLVGK